VRRRILLLVVGMTTLVIIAFAIPMALLIRSSVAQHNQDQTQSQARGVALTIRAFTAKNIKTYVTNLSESTGRPTSVQLDNGSTIIGSTPADDIERPGRSDGADGPGGLGSSDPDSPPATGGAPRGGPLNQLVRAPGGQVAFAGGVLSTGDFFTVRVYLSDDAKYAGESGKFWLLAGAALALIVLGAIAGEILTRRITRPLLETAQTAQQLSHGDTTARAPTDGPTEVADVGRALNRLADRIDQLIAEERETVADLSHRLRTPLTALRLDAEALRDTADAERVGNHVTELERTLTAVIHAARRPQREGRMPSCDAREVVRERIAFWSALTEEQGRRGEVHLPDEPLPIRSSAEDLAAAIDALLENVIAHTPEGTGFEVTLAATPSGARLTVSDEGPGLPEQPPVRGRSDRGSSGLGLDIARRCAEVSGGSMTLGTNTTGGALITLELGAP
jgi:signal transduction histidine kinase